VLRLYRCRRSVRRESWLRYVWGNGPGQFREVATAGALLLYPRGVLVEWSINNEASGSLNSSGRLAIEIFGMETHPSPAQDLSNDVKSREAPDIAFELLARNTVSEWIEVLQITRQSLPTLCVLLRSAEPVVISLGGNINVRETLRLLLTA
jgi:hypothetical protein